MAAESPLLPSVRNAVVRLGQDPPASLDDITNTADIASDFHVSALEEVLAAHDWDFANTYQSAESGSGTPLVKWSAAYKKPKQCVKIRGVWVGDVKLKKNRDFEIVGDQILSAYTVTAVQFTKYIDNPNKWGPGFRAAYEAKLRQVLAYPITTDLRNEIQAEQDYTKLLRNAAGQTYSEGGTDETNFNGLIDFMES